MKERFERFLLITGAAASFGATYWLALLDRSSAATVMAALTVAFMALYFLPFVDSIEAFGLKAKLREKVVEADKVLNGLRSTALVASSIMYAQLGWLGRMGTPSWQEKRQWYTDLERNMRDLEIDKNTIAQMQRPFLAFVSFDIYHPWEQVVGERLQRRARELREELRGAQDDDAKVLALGNDLRAVEAAFAGVRDAYASPEIFNLARLMDIRLDLTPLPEEDKIKLRRLGGRFSRVADEVARHGRITDEALELLEAYFTDHRRWMQDYQSTFDELG